MKIDKSRIAKGLLLALVMGAMGVGAAQALSSNSPERVACPEYPGCDFGGTEFYCCDPV